MKEEVKKILQRLYERGNKDFLRDATNREYIATKIHNLYKLKLPENPYGGDHLWTGFDYCLEQVKEQNKELL